MPRERGSKTLSEHVDVAVVGCGPAGGLLAGRLARDGSRVVVLEKRPMVGVPVRCGEAAGSREEISNFIPVDDAWIVADINAARMYAPNGTYVEKTLPGVGLMLRRDLFDQALAAQAKAWGAEIRTYHEATGLMTDGDVVRGVHVRDRANDRDYDLSARVVVGADGVEGFVGRWAGLAEHLKSREIHAAIEYLCEGDGLPVDMIELYLSRRYAPGGYAWVFPKGAGRANIGVGVHPVIAKDGTARDYLDRFLRDHFPHVTIRKLVAGGVSGTKPLKTLVGNGVLLVGEAGHQNNPFSGGGIMNALEGAEEAHKALREALSTGDVSRKGLGHYDKLWDERNGRVIAKFALLRQLFFKLDDRDLDNVVEVLDGIVSARPGRITDYAEVFRAAFKATPGVLWKASRALW